MVVARVVGNDATIAFGQTGSFLELNVMLPVTAVALLESITLLAAATATSAPAASRACRRPSAARQLVEQGLMLATALAPEIGYDEAATLAKEAFKSGRTIRELALERGMDAGRAGPAARPGGDDRAGPGRGRRQPAGGQRRSGAAPGRMTDGRPEPRPGPSDRSNSSTTPIDRPAGRRTRARRRVHGKSMALAPASTARADRCRRRPGRAGRRPEPCRPSRAVCAAASVGRPTAREAAASAEDPGDIAEPAPPPRPAGCAAPLVDGPASAAPAIATRRNPTARASPAARSLTGSRASPAGPAGRTRRRDGRPQAATDQGRTIGDPRRRRRMEPGVEGAADEVEPSRTSRRPVLEERASSRRRTRRTPGTRVEAT